MPTRLKFAVITGLVGLVIGAIVAVVVQGDGETVPVFVVVPFVSLFALCGAFAKKEWADSVLEFFYHVLP